ncbi:GtrA family protein [Nonomuraea zeae]|uniref:GtrA family protein n=1 Tax=Nonomuraea zeae TaxID=1642303 RepID=UPI0014796FDC|nr:GtrA family protein [Nonomuraea zeae]
MRILRFVTVGSFCFSFQYVCAVLLAGLGAPWPLSNAAGFLLSAQLNFLLSSGWTWRDRPPGWARSALRRRWASYNATAVLALAINTAVFSVSYRALGALPAAALGVLTGSVANYLICDRAVFRMRRSRWVRPGAGVAVAAEAQGR